jgi:hypothetical protein
LQIFLHPQDSFQLNEEAAPQLDAVPVSKTHALRAAYYYNLRKGHFGASSGVLCNATVFLLIPTMERCKIKTSYIKLRCAGDHSSILSFLKHILAEPAKTLQGKDQLYVSSCASPDIHSSFALRKISLCRSIPRRMDSGERRDATARWALLPPELHRPILAELSSMGDLCAIARASRSLQIEAESLIYRNLDFDSDTPFSVSIALFKRISVSAVLALYVRSFRFSISDGEDEDFLSAVFILLSRMLRRCSRLQSLTLKLMFIPHGVNILDWCTFKLHDLDVDFPPESDFRFLETQNHVRILKIWAPRDIQSFEIFSRTAIVLPNLTVLLANPVHASHLIPARPITHLWVVPHNLSPPLELLSITNVPLLALGTVLLPWDPSDERFLDGAARFAPQLEVLHLVLFPGSEYNLVGSVILVLFEKSHSQQKTLEFGRISV